MSNKNLKKAILDKIEKTGFPLELRVSKFLQDNKYYVVNNLYYIDRDESKGREVDMRALKNFDFMKGDIRYFVRHCFLIECKKSADTPWIIFTSPLTVYDKYPFMAQCRGFRKDDKWNIDVVTKGLSTLHPFVTFKHRGRSFSTLKSKEEGKVIYKALTTAVKATIAMRDSDFTSGSNSISFYYPMVILEGQLYEACLDDNNTIVLKEVEAVMVSFYYQSPKYEGEKLVVPIVTERFLPDFCTSMDKVLQFFGELFKANMNWFIKQ